MRGARERRRFILLMTYGMLAAVNAFTPGTPAPLHQKPLWPQRGRPCTPSNHYHSFPSPIRRTVTLSSLIGPDDAWPIYAALTGAAAVGSKLGSTKAGQVLSPPVCAMALVFLLSNVGVLPPGGSAHVLALQGLCVRLAGT